MTWQDNAACRGMDPGIFYGGTGNRPGRPTVRGPEPTDETAAAKAVCAGCPVRDDCLRHALARPEYYGLWGGLTGDERRRLTRRRRAA